MILELFIIVSKHTYICIIYVKGGVLNNYINKYYMQLLKEAVVVGLGTVLVGSVVGAVLGKFFSTNLPTICKEWNKNHIMEISLFLTGFLLHIICEYTGINKWYCKNSYACSK